ncbi:pantoate--beta-alanine ligase, partial [Mesorhizobium sp. M1143]
MPIVRSVDQLRESVAAWRCEGVRIALVPTMGVLH